MRAVLVRVFVQLMSVVSFQGFEYSRSANPNRNDFETLLTSLETGSEETIAFSSGSAATAAAAQWASLSEDEGGARTAEDVAEGRKSHILSINDVVSWLALWTWMQLTNAYSMAVPTDTSLASQNRPETWKPRFSTSTKPARMESGRRSR